MNRVCRVFVKIAVRLEGSESCRLVVTKRTFHTFEANSCLHRAREPLYIAAALPSRW